MVIHVRSDTYIDYIHCQTLPIHILFMYMYNVMYIWGVCVYYIQYLEMYDVVFPLFLGQGLGSCFAGEGNMDT